MRFQKYKTLIKTLISSCHRKTLVRFCLRKKRPEKNFFYTNSELSLNRTEKQIMPFKTTVNWLHYMILSSHWLFSLKNWLFSTKSSKGVYCILKWGNQNWNFGSKMLPTMAGRQRKFWILDVLKTLLRSLLIHNDTEVLAQKFLLYEMLKCEKIRKNYERFFQ